MLAASLKRRTGGVPRVPSRVQARGGDYLLRRSKAVVRECLRASRVSEGLMSVILAYLFTS